MVSKDGTVTYMSPTVEFKLDNGQVARAPLDFVMSGEVDPVLFGVTQTNYTVALPMPGMDHIQHALAADPSAARTPAHAMSKLLDSTVRVGLVMLVLASLAGVVGAL